MSDIRKYSKAALEGALKTANDALGANALPVQWEACKYEPVEGQPYMKVDFLIAGYQDPELSSYFQETGIMQVMMLYPDGEGAGDAIAFAEKVRGWFAKGLNLSSNGVNVTVNRTPKIASGASDGSRYAVPVQITYLARNAN